ncbi:outer membrane protein assembly factor BamE [Bermanella sp. WJH001]|uniref:outer membrane protein assembly factor BamE n=1 Tax=Bermanella sp. WJH001 TaxID=3048005 RepID=UPI0024BE0D7B|nr:outer membrane protein assembly factor BamE [Bermanella sp. WJH001]MDJ1539294.1 outer membrane protein assembly factor BamE [Bermanella sp. WJH001]
MFRFIITATVLLFLSACSMQVYKLNVQQGNIVTQDMLDKLKPGMNKGQVAYIMGNPVLKDTFSTRFWDYTYRTERREDEIKQYHIRVHFDNAQKYSHFEGQLPESTAPELQKDEDKPVKVFGD